MPVLTLRIDNMHCGSCIRRVAQTLNALPETHADEVRVGSARITTTAAPEQIQQALAAAGYPALVELNAGSKLDSKLDSSPEIHPQKPGA